MKQQDYPPPSHLSPKSQALWRELVPSRGRSPGRLALLTVALEARDRADEAAAVIAVEGLTTTTETTKAVHIHPLVKVERECRAQFITAWRELHFGFDPHVDGRMPSAEGFM